MGKFVLIGAAVLAVIIVGGLTFLAAWDVPAPSVRVEHAIPDAKLAK